MSCSHDTTRDLVSGVLESLWGSHCITGWQQGGVTHNKTFGEEESLMSRLGLHHVFFHGPCPGSVLDFRTNVDMLPHAEKSCVHLKMLLKQLSHHFQFPLTAYLVLSLALHWKQISFQIFSMLDIWVQDSSHIFEQFTHTAPAPTCGRRTTDLPLIWISCQGAHLTPQKSLENQGQSHAV